MNSALHDTAEQSPDQSRAGEDSGALANLLRLVPRAQDPLHADEAAGFENSLEETDDHDLPGVVHECRAESEKTPRHASGRQPESGADFLHDQVVRDLAQKITPVKDCVDLVELGAFEVEVFAGAGYIGVVEVGAVEIVDLRRTD